MPANTLEHTVYNWLRALNIHVSKTYFDEQLRSHPDFPSLLSVTDTLDDLGIENIAASVEKEQLQDIPLPFLTHNYEGRLDLIDDRSKLDSPGFSNGWDGIVLAAEKRDTSNDVDKKSLIERNRKMYFLSFLALAITGFSVLTLCQNFTTLNLLLLLTSLPGIAVSVLIVFNELGIANELTDPICMQGDKIDCNAIIRSGGLSSWISWGDIGLVFFLSQWASLIVFALFDQLPLLLPVFKIAATGSLGFILFSVYYQWKVAKKWCLLCLSVALLLIVQFTAVAAMQPEWLPSGLTAPIFILLSAIAIFSVWFLVKTNLRKNIELQKKQLVFSRFKNNPKIFSALLKQQRRAEIIPLENELEIASPEAPLKITVACNPYCNPCAHTHTILHQLADKHAGDLSIAIRFTVSESNPGNRKDQAVEKILKSVFSEKSRSGNAGYIGTVLGDWFSDMDLQEFSKKYNAGYQEATEDSVRNTLKNHARWAADTGIAFTPTVFINGYELPRQYTVADLPVLVRGLISEPML
ncbi:MAG TPA: vitamin K epoxide reductase family protein [Puia sp.]